jgi:outer membrane protein assembly factor BamB
VVSATKHHNKAKIARDIVLKFEISANLKLKLRTYSYIALHFSFNFHHTFVASGRLYIKEDNFFNYERYTDYTFTFRAQDAFHWSETRTLSIQILDKNEAPDFTYTSYTVELDEETVGHCKQMKNLESGCHLYYVKSASHE